MIATTMKPFAEGDFVKDCLLKASEIVCPDKKQCFANISLSRNTVAQRVSEMADDLTAQLRNKAKGFKFSPLLLMKVRITQTVHRLCSGCVV